jgi:hypothetical protein
MDNDAGCIIFALMAIALFVGLAILAAQNSGRANALREAQEAYQSSLTALKASPTNADLKGTTLQKGRIYSNLTRNNKGVTMYDEVALMNDINAACAGAGASQPATNNDRSIDERLARLQQLRERELISAQEYEQRRAEIIKEV